MPSTLVHLAVAALIAAGLFRDFDGRVLAVALVGAAIPDLDTFLALVWSGAHRAVLHTAVVPALGAALLVFDRRVRGSSVIRRLGPRAHRLAGLAIVTYLAAGIGPDLMTNGVNLFYPLHDRFYSLSGQIYLSSTDGLVQTLWEPMRSVVGSTTTHRYPTGIAPTQPAGEGSAPVERIFPIAHSGFQALLIGIAVGVTSWRLWSAEQR